MSSGGGDVEAKSERELRRVRIFQALLTYHERRAAGARDSRRGLVDKISPQDLADAIADWLVMAVEVEVSAAILTERAACIAECLRLGVNPLVTDELDKLERPPALETPSLDERIAKLERAAEARGAQRCAAALRGRAT